MSIRIQLLLVGLAIMAYLGARWWWLERKADKLSPREDATPQPLSAEPSERIEPTMPMAHGLQADVPPNEREHPEFSDTQVLADLPLATIDRSAILNQQIDCMAMLDIDEPCSGDFALSLLPATRRIGSKTWLVEGLNTLTEKWEPVVSGQMYRYFQAGIQLVNRNGPLNDVEFSEFVAKAGDVADGLGASTEFPEMLAEVSRAEVLAQFTKAHDVRLSLNVHARRAAWSFPYLQQHARSAGFVAGALPGRWILGDSRQDMIALTIDSHLAMADDLDAVPIRKLTLSLDVPQVARIDDHNQKPFDVMSDIAIKLCASMEAVIADEQGHTVDLEALQRTSTELEAVYDRLDEVGLSAGSPMAKRLFS
jgi:hypothetical protein